MMNKQEIINKISNESEKIFVSKLLDKYHYSISRNKITVTNFINSAEKELTKKILSNLKIKNYLLYSGYEYGERNIVVFYPEKFDISIVNKNLHNLLGVIRIELPKELYSKFEHRNYLSAIIKLGISRERVGDILVFENGADIIATQDMLEYLSSNLSSLTRFKKSKITVESIENLRIIEPKKEEIQIIIPSTRLDSIVSELCHTSRNRACEIIESERVFINYLVYTKSNTFLKENDILTIRKNGKYIIGKTLGQTKKGNIILEIKKFQ